MVLPYSMGNSCNLELVCHLPQKRLFHDSGTHSRRLSTVCGDGTYKRSTNALRDLKAGFSEYAGKQARENSARVKQRLQSIPSGSKSQPLLAILLLFTELSVAGSLAGDISYWVNLSEISGLRRILSCPRTLLLYFSVSFSRFHFGKVSKRHALVEMTSKPGRYHLFLHPLLPGQS